MILAFPSPSQLIYISKPDLLFGDLFYMKWNIWGFDFETKSSILEIDDVGKQSCISDWKDYVNPKSRVAQN